MNIISEHDIGNTVFYDYGNGTMRGQVFEIRVIRQLPDGSYDIAYVIERIEVCDSDKSDEASSEGDVVEEDRTAKTKKVLKNRLVKLEVKRLERQKKLINKQLIKSRKELLTK